ncbi:MAG TPA: 50S ribosomal protein L22 [Candidatus Babeliales bacterium]|jgi:large subunit ribosomal protein L22|nr:50S ribosomal protein L22 [Candidatus Babeliales bacterium]
MRFNAKARYIPVSPYKLRPIADVIRGKNVHQALTWLATCSLKRVVPLKKAIESAVANAVHMQGMVANDLIIKIICIDQGPIRRYFKPGAMGRSSIQRERKSHIHVVLESN